MAWEASREKIRFAICDCLFLPAQNSGPQSREKLAIGEHTADVAGIHFWYRVAGKGPLLVVQAPGRGAGSKYLQNGLAQLENDFTLIYLDLRGNAQQPSQRSNAHGYRPSGGLA